MIASPRATKEVQQTERAWWPARWASCSSKGRLTFDSSLLIQLAHFRTHVIVHELVHLKVPNRGKLFRSLVQAYLSEAA
jgi:predicted metal-dependent hydrolase